MSSDRYEKRYEIDKDLGRKLLITLFRSCILPSCILEYFEYRLGSVSISFRATFLEKLVNRISLQSQVRFGYTE